MKEYDVTITETLKMTVTVEAESQMGRADGFR
ncbi:MAG: DpnD/PcfM family protein [Oscillospiraceae bacterium]